MPNWDSTQCTFSFLMSASSISALLKIALEEENTKGREQKLKEAVGVQSQIASRGMLHGG